jgi:hypothetical protein
MTRAYVITEKKTDRDILKSVLPQSTISNVEFVSGSGSYAAQSLARTILSVRGRPVALVLDADTIDDQIIQEKRTFLHQMLHVSKDTVAFEVFIAVPYIESILLYDKNVFDHIIGYTSSEAEWKLAQAQTRTFLAEHFSEHESAVHAILTKLTQDDIETIRRHPLLQQLDDFLRKATEAHNNIPALAP